MKIILGSTNPVKIEAVRLALSSAFSELEVVSVEVKSGVADQPRTQEETRLGSVNRAKSALLRVEGDIGLGLEGGIYKLEDEIWNTVWCSAVDLKGKITSVSGLNFKLPSKLIPLVSQGQEVGPAMDLLLNRKNTKQQEGMMGIVTQGILSRGEAYSSLVKLAVGRLLSDWE